MIEIVPYRQNWPEDYAKLADVIRRSVGEASMDIHHIGSTAVPGLAAKDTIDIQISLDDLKSNVEAGMQSAGFRLVPQISDHCPPGQNLPAEQLEKRFYKYLVRPANIHVRQVGRFNQRYPLLCRDYLRSHGEAADAYSEIKRALATRFPDDQVSYYAVKDPVFDLIMVAAEEWATATGWTLPLSDS